MTFLARSTSIRQREAAQRVNDETTPYVSVPSSCRLPDRPSPHGASCSLFRALNLFGFCIRQAQSDLLSRQCECNQRITAPTGAGREGNRGSDPRHPAVGQGMRLARRQHVKTVVENGSYWSWAEQNNRAADRTKRKSRRANEAPDGIRQHVHRCVTRPRKIVGQTTSRRSPSSCEEG